MEISRGTNAAIIPQANESDDYFTKLLGEPFTVVENELYKSPVVNNNTPSVEPKEENSSMTAEQIAEQPAAAKASSANRNGAASVTVYTDKPMTFSTDMLDAIYAADVNLSYDFRYEGKLYMISFPSEAKVDLGGSKYEGPLFVGSLLGTTQVIE